MVFFKIKTWQMNIFLKANDIINARSEEKNRSYGSMEGSMKKAAAIATELCNKEITIDDMFKCMMALKLSRIAHTPKEDSLLDLVAYAGAFNNFKNNNQNDQANNKNIPSS